MGCRGSEVQILSPRLDHTEGRRSTMSLVCGPQSFVGVARHTRIAVDARGSPWSVGAGTRPEGGAHGDSLPHCCERRWPCDVPENLSSPVAESIITTKRNVGGRGHVLTWLDVPDEYGGRLAELCGGDEANLDHGTRSGCRQNAQGPTRVGPWAPTHLPPRDGRLKGPRWRPPGFRRRSGAPTSGSTDHSCD